MNAPAPTLLIIDDDAPARRMMRRLLGKRGYDTREAPDGRHGLDAARADAPAAVLLDLRMPGELSGLDVARALRSEPATANIVIIVVSASTHLDAREAVEQIGCNAFIEKPVDFDELDRVLAEFVPH